MRVFQEEIFGPVLAVTTFKDEARAHGPLLFFQSGGCCDGSSPICLTQGELPLGPGDVLLGDIGGAPFCIDAEQYERWRRPRFEIDISSGAAEGFSLEGLEGVHFVTKTRGG